jgi:hypothetical protein
MSRGPASLAAQTAALAFAAPQVVASRMLRMTPSEFNLMGSEKIFAAAESWNAMLLQSAFEGQKLAFSMMMSFWFPWLPRPGPRQVRSAAIGVLGKGIAPYRRRAVANAKRLRRAR